MLKYASYTSFIFALVSCSDSKTSFLADRYKSTKPEAAAANEAAPASDAKVEDKKEEKPNDPFRLVQPVLALRQASCVSCHAKISGDLVTDFAVGTKHFFGDNNFGDKNQARIAGYAFFPQTYQGLNITGRLVVPALNIDSAYVRSKFGNPTSLTLAKLLRTDINEPIFAKDGTTENGSALLKTLHTIDPKRDRSLPGIDELLETSSIKINPPNAALIEKTFQDQAKIDVSSKGNISIKKAKNDNSVSGFNIKAGKSENYVTNDKDTVCIGDVFVRGTLVLKDLRLNTSKEGCRLHVTGTVFITGGITYTADEDNSNLQVVTPRPIFLGIRKIEGRLGFAQMNEGYFDLKDVLAERDNVGDVVRDDSGPYMLYYSGIMNKSNLSAISYQDSPEEDGPIDASKWQTLPGKSLSATNCSYGELKANYNCAITRNSDYERRSIDYKHVLFVAPEFHSRYHGLFRGSVIANSALFSLGELQFAFDPVLKTANVFPLIKEDIFKVDLEQAKNAIDGGTFYSSYCRMELTRCDLYPQYIGTSFDNYLNSQYDPARCAQRPKEYNDWCMNAVGTVLKATFRDAQNKATVYTHTK